MNAMSHVTRRDNSRPNRNIGGGIWNPVSARVASEIAKAAGNAAINYIKGGGAKSAISPGSGRPTVIFAGGSQPKGRARRNKKESIPRGVRAGRVGMVVNGCSLLANDAGNLCTVRYTLGLHSTTLNPQGVFSTTLFGAADGKILGAFRYMHIKRIVVTISPFVDQNSWGYVGFGMRNDSFPGGEALGLEAVSNCPVNHVGSIHQEATISYQPTRNKGIARSSVDMGQESIDFTEMHAGALVITSHNSKPTGDNIAVLKISAVLELWNDKY